MTLVGMSARIRARPLRPNEAALVVNAQGSGAMGVLNKNRKLVVPVEQAYGAGLFLCKQQAAVFCADDAVGIVGSLPDELPFGSGRDDPWDGGNRHLPHRRGLWESPLPSGVSLLCDSNHA